MKHLVLCAALLLAPTGAPQPLFAGELSDLIMAPGLFAQMPEGELLRYTRDRQLPGDAETLAAPGMTPLRPVLDGQVILARNQADRLVLSLGDGHTPSREMADFPAGAPNPVLMVFFEDVMRAIAAQTGGSPFYLRNRIRASMAEAGLGQSPSETTQTEHVTARLLPFAGDPNAARLGDWASLALTIEYAPDAPWRLTRLSAATDAAENGYQETMVLMSEE